MTLAELVHHAQSLIAARPELAGFDFHLEGPTATYGCRALHVAPDEPIVTALLEPFTVRGVLNVP